MNRKYWINASLFLLSAPAFAANTLQDEYLLQGLPEGFMAVTQERQGNMSLTEWIPVGETVDNWTEMVTTQIFHGARGSFDAYKDSMKKHWDQECDSSTLEPIKEGTENGYAYQFWVQMCRFNDKKRPPEITTFKMIKGNDSTYVVQHAVHFEPSKDQIVKWTRYMANVSVCDSRIKDRACPIVKNAKQDR